VGDNLQFLYVIKEDDRKKLLEFGCKELFNCYFNNEKAYAFEYIDVTSKVDKKDIENMLILNVANF
jgi:hypothetical protein